MLSASKWQWLTDSEGKQVILFSHSLFLRGKRWKNNAGQISSLSLSLSLRAPAKCSNSFSVLTHLGQLLFPHRGTGGGGGGQTTNNNNTDRQLRSPVDLCRDVPSCQALHQPAAQSISRTDLSKWEERAVPTSLSRPEWGFSFAVNLLINPSPLHCDCRHDIAAFSQILDVSGTSGVHQWGYVHYFKQKKKKKSFTVVAVNDFGALLHMRLKLFGRALCLHVQSFSKDKDFKTKIHVKTTKKLLG